MYKFLKRCCQLFLLAVAGVILFFNAGFYYSPDYFSDPSDVWNIDVCEQYYFLTEEMDGGAAAEMQQLFPEGYLFMNALYGLTGVEIAAPLHRSGFTHFDANRELILREIDEVLVDMNSDLGRRIFSEELVLPYGAFYRGWTNYLTGKRLEAAPLRPDSSDVNLVNFQQTCDDIAQAFKQSEGPYLESYHIGIWPVDNALAIASLASYDRYFDTLRYRPLIEEWIGEVKAQLDPTTGLIPHVVYEGAPPQSARGSSQSLILSLLPEIDSTFAAEQYALYQKHFVDSRLGLPAIREYPRGIEGKGDIDSGPVIWGIGGAASVVGQRAAYANGDFKLYKGLRNSIEAFGFGFTCFGEKRYVFGQLPIADAFIAWSNSVEKTPVDAPVTIPWLIHLISVIFLVVIGWVGYKL